MPVALVRIDSRLIHGQIIEAWTPYLKLDCILVADDDVASDLMQKAIIKMSVPRHITVAVGTVREIVDNLNAGMWVGKTTLVIFSDVESVCRAVEYGLQISQLNVGNIHHTPDRTQVTPSVSLNEKEIDSLRQLERKGIRVELRSVPKQKPMLLYQISFS
jgi:mannose/fructose/N-acetylgalactosamine-specific phosphotransferase system component IIB